MNFVTHRVSGPDDEPVTLEEFKLHIRHDSDIGVVEDTLLASWLKAAREYCEGYTGRAVSDSLWQTTVIDHDGGDLRLYRSPVLQIVSVHTVAADGTTTEVDAADYALHEDDRYPRLVGVAAADEVRVRFRAGYVDTVSSPTTGEIPEAFRSAILLVAEAYYSRNERMMPILMNAATALMRDLRAALQLA